MLSDRDLRAAVRNGELAFTPRIRQSQIGPASIDLRLGKKFMVFKLGRAVCLDPKQGLPKEHMEAYVLENGKPFVLHPNAFVLTSTWEYIKVGSNLAVRVEGKSTLARMGILVHTAGFVDPGYEGPITLEISNHSGLPVLLYSGMYICQVAVHELSSPAEVPYNLRKRSAYKKDTHNKNGGPTPANTKNLFK